MDSSVHKKIVNSLGGGIAIAGENFTGNPVQVPSSTDPAPPVEGMPNAPFSQDVEKYCEVNHYCFLGQDESDPSFLVFETITPEGEKGYKFKLPAELFRTGFRGSNEGEEE